MNTAPISPDIVRDLRKKKRIQLVHVAKHQLGLTDDNYRAILSQWSVASSKDMSLFQLGQLLDYFKVLGFRGRPGYKALASPSSAYSAPLREKKKYASTIAGLKDEITDLAKARWGGAWELPLNNFCLRFGIKRWQWLDVAHGKEVKAVLLRLQRSDTETQS